LIGICEKGKFSIEVTVEIVEIRSITPGAKNVRCFYGVLVAIPRKIRENFSSPFFIVMLCAVAMLLSLRESFAVISAHEIASPQPHFPRQRHFWFGGRAHLAFLPPPALA
jgi:hypothetical protein